MDWAKTTAKRDEKPKFWDLVCLTLEVWWQTDVDVSLTKVSKIPRNTVQSIFQWKSTTSSWRSVGNLQILTISVPFPESYINPSGDATRMRQENQVNTMAADALAPCVTRPSAALASWNIIIWFTSQRCTCLVTWFCYHLIAKPGNKRDAASCVTWSICRISKSLSECH